MQPRLRLAAFYGIFFLSGIGGLSYQVVWSRMFAAGLGHELPAVLAVVAAFFGGLALGAWLLDGAVSRSHHPGRWYAALELVIGLWGALSILLIPRMNVLAAGLIGIDATPVRHWTVAFALPLLALLPATASMGATLPAMERCVAPLLADRKCVGALYGLNTLGAVAGALACTFLVAPALGFRGTVLVLVGLNLLCGLFVWGMEFRVVSPAEHAKSTPEPVVSRGLYPALFVTGLLGIGFEVLGVRALAQVLEGTVYTFAVTLAVYLLGTTLGAAFYQWKLRQLEFRTLLGWLLAGVSTASLSGVWLLSRAPALYERLRADWGDTSLAVITAELGVSATVFLFPTLFMGATFSHLAQWAKRERGGVGRALALNTLGGALAPAIFGVIALPALGLKWSLVAVALGYLFLLPRIGGWQWTGLVFPLTLIFLLPPKIQFVQAPPGGRLIEFREGTMDSVAVVEHFDGNRSLLVNHRFAMGGTGSAVAERRHAHLPLLLHPAPKRALFLGLGTGITFAAAGAHRGLEADGVELVPEVVEVMSRFSPENDFALNGARLRVRVADARRFVRVGDLQYDVIVADLFHPARDGAGALYTREHFQAVRRRLAAGGLFCQWLPLHQLDEAMLRVIVGTFLDVFPHARAYLLRLNVDTPVLGLVGTTGPTRYPAGWFEQRARDFVLLEQLKPLTLTDAYQLFGCLVANADGLRKFSDGAPINTDDRPVVIFGAPRFAYQRRASSYGRLLALLDLRGADLSDLVRKDAGSETAEFVERLRKFIQARDVYLRGLVAEAENRMSEGLDRYVESARISPDFSTGYARCLTLAMQQSGSDPRAARALLQRLIEAQPQRPIARDLLHRLPNGP